MDNPNTSNLPFPVLPGHVRRPLAGWILPATANAGMVILILGWLAGIEIVEESWGESASVLWAIILFPLLFLIMPTYVKLIARGRKMRAIPAELVLQRNQAPVVLLRSFNDDDMIDPSYPITNEVVPGRYEDRLIKALAPLGPAIALGRPEEPHPQLGAARLYVKDNDWQHAISYLMKRAKLVLAVVGSSPGLWWEIEFAIQQIPMERLLFFFPYPLPQKIRGSFWRTSTLINPVWGRFIRPKIFPAMKAERQTRYDDFRKQINSWLPHPLPEELGDARFISFSPNGQPMLINPVKPPIWARLITLNLNSKMDIPFERELQSFIKRITGS